MYDTKVLKNPQNRATERYFLFFLHFKKHYHRLKLHKYQEVCIFTEKEGMP